MNTYAKVNVGAEARTELHDSLQLTGWGTFSVAKRAARKGRNPSTGKEIKIAACKTPKFKAGKILKDSLK